MEELVKDFNRESQNLWEDRTQALKERLMELAKRGDGGPLISDAQGAKVT